jgi:hypothetical protein
MKFELVSKFFPVAWDNGSEILDCSNGNSSYAEFALVHSYEHGICAIVLRNDKSFDLLRSDRIVCGLNPDLTGTGLLSKLITEGGKSSRWCFIYHSGSRKILVYPQMIASGRHMLVSTFGIILADFSSDDEAKLELMNQYFRTLTNTPAANLFDRLMKLPGNVYDNLSQLPDGSFILSSCNFRSPKYF